MTVNDTINGLTNRVNSNTPGLRTGSYTLEECTCCQRLFWRHDNDAPVCGECLPYP